jgi:hypothetical protein
LSTTTYIGDYAFAGCKSIEKMHDDETLDNI